MDRRNFLRCSAASSLALAGAGLLGENLFGQDNKNQKQYIDNGGEGAHEHLTCYPDTQNGKHQLYQLWIRKNNTVLTSYRTHQTQKYPFFYPMAGPLSGLSLTSESGSPWPHHRSVFFGADKVNKGNYWQDSLSRGQIVSQGPSFAKDENGLFKIDDVSAEIVDRCLWKKPDEEPIIEDNRRFVVRVLDPRRYILDAVIDFKALVDVTIEQTNHGFFGVRCAPDIATTGGGALVSSEGVQGEKATLGKPARWLAFCGKRAGLKEEIHEGIAVFCPSKAPHPAFENCPWFTRDYGNISPMPFLWFQKDKPLQIPKGMEIKFRYRVVAFGGSPKEADLDGLWTEFDNAG